MEWNLPDLAFKHKVRLVNWPTSLANKGDQPKVNWKPSAAALHEIIPLLKKKHKLDGDEDEDDEEGADDSAPRIESWTEGKRRTAHTMSMSMSNIRPADEKDLPENEQADLAVLITTDDVELQHVRDGTKFRRALAANEKKEKEKSSKSKGKQAKSAPASKSTAPAVKTGSGREARAASVSDADVATANAPAGNADCPRPRPKKNASNDTASAANRSSGGSGEGGGDDVGRRSPRPPAPRPVPSSSKIQLDARSGEGKVNDLTRRRPPGPVASSSKTAVVGGQGVYQRARASGGEVGDDDDERPAKRPRLENDIHHDDEREVDDRTVGVKRKRVDTEVPGPPAAPGGRPTAPPAIRVPHDPPPFFPGQFGWPPPKVSGPPAAPAPAPAARWPTAPLALPHPEALHTKLPEPQVPRREFFVDGEEIRLAAPGAPARPVEAWMSPKQRLEMCFHNLPGMINPREKRCRYELGGQYSREFFVSRFEDREVDNPVEEDEAAGCLSMHMKGEWVLVDENRIPVIADRHVDYHSAIYADFF